MQGKTQVFYQRVQKSGTESVLWDEKQHPAEVILCRVCFLFLLFIAFLQNCDSLGKDPAGQFL